MEINETGLPKRPDGSTDWTEALRLARLNPPQNPDQLAAQIRASHGAELQRIARLTDSGRNLKPLEDEVNARRKAHEQQCEAEGRKRQQAERKRMADALHERELGIASQESPLEDRRVKAQADYDAAVKLIQGRTAQPINLTDDEAREMWERNQNIRTGQKNAIDASLRDRVRKDVSLEKY